MPELRVLRVATVGDEDGAPQPFEAFDWLLAGDGLPALEELDAREVDAEPARSKPSFVERWAAAPVTRRLRRLGINGDLVKTSHLKKHHAAFEHLEFLVVSNLLSAGDRNPVKRNVLFESEFSDRTLSNVSDAIGALPDLRALKPSMKDDEFAAMVEAVLEAPIRYPEGALSSMLGRFVKCRQWERVEQLLDLAKGKAPFRRAFMEVREKVQAQVATALEKAPDDATGTALHARLEAQNTY